MSKRALLAWDIYEIRAAQTKLHGAMLRGKIRKLGLRENINVLCENASDAENCVRFAVIAGSQPDEILAYLRGLIKDATIQKVAVSVQNPVLSKLKVNDGDRYTL